MNELDAHGSFLILKWRQTCAVRRILCWRLGMAFGPMPMETLVLLAMGNAAIHAQEPSFHHDCIHLTLHLVHQHRSHQRYIASMKSALINFYFQKQRLVID